MERCWKCRRPTERTTRLVGPRLGYCPEHVPDRLRAFQRECLVALLEGRRRRLGRNWCFAPTA